MIGLMKCKLNGGKMEQCVKLRSKMNSYLTDNGYIDKKIKSFKKCLTKRYVKFEDNKKCLGNN